MCIVTIITAKYRILNSEMKIVWFLQLYLFFHFVYSVTNFSANRLGTPKSYVVSFSRGKTLPIYTSIR